MARHVHIIVAIAATCVSDQLFFFPNRGEAKGHGQRLCRGKVCKNLLCFVAA